MAEERKPEPEIIINAGDYDATELIRKIRAEIEKEERQAAGRTPPAGRGSGKLHEELAHLNLACRIDTVNVPVSDRPVLGPVINLLKKMLRPLLAWFVVPLIDRVSDFNMQVVGFLYHQLGHLDREAAADLPARVARLERSRLQAVQLPGPAATAPLDTTRFYERFVAPRRAELEAVKPYLAGSKKVLILGAGKGELAALLDGETVLVERNRELLPEGLPAETADDYCAYLSSAALRDSALVIDDYLGDWGSQRLQSAFATFADAAAPGKCLVYIAPSPVEPPYPLLRLDLFVPPSLVVFLMESAGLGEIAMYDPLPGTGKYLVRGEVVCT